jgi:chromosome segregation ATPase
MRVRVPPPASVHPLLSFADDLERRDALVAAALARVEAEQAEVDALRARAAAAADVLAWLGVAVPANDRALHRAAQERDSAAAALSVAEDDARPAAETALAAADAECARLEEHRDAFARRAEEARDEVEQVARAAGASGLEAAIAALSHRRGALLVERSGLARERESIVREASELLGSVLGDPLAATSVAGLRDRLQRAL